MGKFRIEKYVNISGKFSSYTTNWNMDDREKKMKVIHIKNLLKVSSKTEGFTNC